MHTISSRRALLAGAPAVAAAALAAGAIANAAVLGLADEVGDDAELLALKPQVDDALGEWIFQHTKDCRDRREFGRLHLARFGFELDDAPEIDWNDPGYLAYDREIRRLVDEHHSGRSQDELDLGHWDRIHNKLSPLVDEVLSYNASTLDGLRLQTRVLIICQHEIWSPTHWSDDELKHPMCDFFESLCGVLGIPFPPVPERFPA